MGGDGGKRSERGTLQGVARTGNDAQRACVRSMKVWRLEREIRACVHRERPCMNASGLGFVLCVLRHD